MRYRVPWTAPEMQNEIANNVLSWIQQWYYSHCDGNWEHGYGIRIDTLDNPGWSISINLEETALESKEFSRHQVERSESDWVDCWKAGNVFEAACGPLNLTEALEVFQRWTIS